jgi:S-methylmethionine-dependent homocysteine/selenocysteine methylase
MSTFGVGVPEPGSGLYLTDAGPETHLTFDRGIAIHERATLADHLRGFLALARDIGAGFVLDSPTRNAHPPRAGSLQATEADLERANHDAVAFIAGLRAEFAGDVAPIVLNGLVGPRGDASAPTTAVGVDEAEDYHATQIGWLADTEVDMVTACTFTESAEATGAVRAARDVDLPIVVSFTVETDGALPDGESLRGAIDAVDAATDGAAEYFMVDCAHPDHFVGLIEDAAWARRIHGVRANASRLTDAERDDDNDNDEELAAEYGELFEVMPWLQVLGACGADLRHVVAIARAVPR